MTNLILLRIELLKLFRRSNVLFFFLAIYIIVTGYQGGFEVLRENSDPTAYSLFIGLSHGMSVWCLLFMALFMVNNTGNDFVEGSFRKNVAMGLLKWEYFKGKLILLMLFAFMVIFFLLLSYFFFVLFSDKVSVFQLKISGIILFHQLVALIIAGLFGMFFIMAFRNRTVGLVFFPFWFMPEFLIFAMETTGWLQTNISDYLPGVTAWKLFAGYKGIENELYIGISISLIFGFLAWAGLILREEKPS